MLKKVKEYFAGERDYQEDAAAFYARTSAERVYRFSSQYGSETSRGYTAQNLAGNHRRYPSYGDFTEAFVTRAYGEWWSIVPSTPVEIGQSEPWFQATDFVDLYYSNAVIPTKIEIYETYNPGAVVRILACNKAPHESFIDPDQIRWEVLWQGSPLRAETRARIFTPEINKLSFPSRMIRLEFNQKLCEYYTELDAVYLTGATINMNTALQEAIENSLAYLDINKLSIDDGQNDKKEKKFENYFQTQSSVDERDSCGYFQILPDEIITVILSNLTFHGLMLLACTCKFFKAFTYDPLWHKELNLQPYWPKVNNKALKSIVTRCDGIEKLNMSWLGPLGSISSDVFNYFIEDCGSSLTHLRLAVCDFVNIQSLEIIANICTHLIELNLSSCQIGSNDDISRLKNLNKLKILNLYRIPVHEDALVEIFRSCVDLEILNIGSNTAIENGNRMLEELAKNCRKLRCLDLWRMRNIDGQGVIALCQYCTNLEEIDFGWCSHIKSPRESIIKLAKKCTKLKKLFLTAVRSINNDDMEALANNCPLLEQLDILGTGNVDPFSIERLFEKCKNLKMLDVSFCSRIIEAGVIRNWRKTQPQIAFKYSFTS